MKLIDIIDTIDSVYDILLASRDDKPLGIQNEYYNIKADLWNEEVYLFRPLDGTMAGCGIKVYLKKTLQEIEKSAYMYSVTKL